MKKFVIGLFLIGFTSHMYSQQLDNGFPKSEQEFNNSLALNSDHLPTLHKKWGNPNIININYINNVIDVTMSRRVKDLEEKAAIFNVKNAKSFDGSSRPFKVVFKSPIGSITAMFSSDGEILTTTEHYVGVKLSVPVRTSVLKAYPGWAIENSQYKVNYNNVRDTKRVYKVLLLKNNSK
ncbi:MAG TPA: hypothetical protein VKN14_15415, partial [Flavobacteriaceae bacterium]|nr:hypothetical protein [Flavobacteriaceae bacterium]